MLLPPWSPYQITGVRAAGGPQGRDVADFTQPFRPAEEESARALLLGYPGVTAIRELLATFVGPGRVWIVARVDIDDGLSGSRSSHWYAASSQA